MEDVLKIDIVYDGLTEGIYCEKVSDSIYKCLESSLAIDFINYGCEIEVKREGDSLTFLGLFKESPFQTFRYLWSREILNSSGAETMRSEIINLGGHWEILMGGYFIFHLPKSSGGELDRLFELLKVE